VQGEPLCVVFPEHNKLLCRPGTPDTMLTVSAGLSWRKGRGYIILKKVHNLLEERVISLKAIILN